MNRRRLIVGGLASACFIASTRFIASARAQGYSYPNENEIGPEVNVSPDLAQWFEGLKRPDIDPPGVTSCCDFGDAYPCEILEEAEPHTLEWGRLRITDTSARTLKIPTDGGAFHKYRLRITDEPPLYQYQGIQVTREKDGNPTATAWVFASVYGGKLVKIYCVVPLPPGV